MDGRPSSDQHCPIYIYLFTYLSSANSHNVSERFPALNEEEMSVSGSNRGNRSGRLFQQEGFAFSRCSFFPLWCLYCNLKLTAQEMAKSSFHPQTAPHPPPHPPSPSGPARRPQPVFILFPDPRLVEYSISRKHRTVSECLNLSN